VLAGLQRLEIYRVRALFDPKNILILVGIEPSSHRKTDPQIAEASQEQVNAALCEAAG
jgi:hypothetical protein